MNQITAGQGYQNRGLEEQGVCRLNDFEVDRGISGKEGRIVGEVSKVGGEKWQWIDEVSNASVR